MNSFKAITVSFVLLGVSFLLCVCDRGDDDDSSGGETSEVYHNTCMHMGTCKLGDELGFKTMKDCYQFLDALSEDERGCLIYAENCGAIEECLGIFQDDDSSVEDDDTGDHWDTTTTTVSTTTTTIHPTTTTYQPTTTTHHPTTTQQHCSLTCLGDGYSYTCGSSDYSMDADYCYDGLGQQHFSSLHVSYSNGHDVNCSWYSGCSDHGESCSDDTGAHCSY